LHFPNNTPHPYLSNCNSNNINVYKAPAYVTVHRAFNDPKKMLAFKI
jgi:hypothetical protein